MTADKVFATSHGQNSNLLPGFAPWWLLLARWSSCLRPTLWFPAN